MQHGVGSARPLDEPPRASTRHRRSSRWWRRRVWTPGRIVGLYALISILWIAFSDRALYELLPDPHARERAETLKGAGFVLVTSILLLELIRRSELGPRKVEREVLATLDSMADAVLVVDAATHVVEANRAAVELLGVRSKEDLFGPIYDWGRRFDLRTLDGRPVPQERYASVRAQRGERVAPYEAILRRADGTDVFVSVSATTVAGTGLAVAVLRDVSAARRLDEMREEFLATAAHEFKTPLAVVKAYAQLLQRREPREVQALAVIERQVDRLSRLVQYLLDTSRLRLDGDAPQRDRFDLGDVAREVVERIRPTAPIHALTLEVASPAPVLADRARIDRVVTSLVDNAIRFSPRGGPVAARVEVRDGQAVVSVVDRGLGIALERQGRIFERYYRAHAGTPHDYGGFGVGLDVSREIVGRHGGRMWFESVPGEGSTFHFSLPLAAEAP